MNRRQKIIVSVTGIFLVLLLLVGLTYAYFLTRITGNTNDKSISVSTANLALVYRDGNGLIEPDTEIMPGSVLDSKTFTVTNEGNDTTEYVVVIEDTSVTYAQTIEVNGVTQTAGDTTTFESNDFVYTLTCKSYENYGEATQAESGTCNGVDAEATFPIKGGILIGNNAEVGKTHAYSLTVTYKETGVDQSADMNKILTAKVNIADPNGFNPYVGDKGSLAYTIINNAVTVTSAEKEDGYAEYRALPLTTPAVETTMTYADNGAGTESTRNYITTKTFTATNAAKYYITYGDTATYTTNYTITNKDGSALKAVLVSTGYETLKGKYIVTNSGSTSTSPVSGSGKSKIYYVTNATSTTIETLELSGGLASNEKYITYGDSYKFDKSTGTYTLQNVQVVKYKEGYKALVGKYVVNTSGANTATTATSTNLLSIYLVTGNSTETKMTYKTITKKSTEESYGSAERTLTTTADEYGTSYYFRGDVENNYLTFNNGNNDTCWRIVRIEGDGAIKMVLADATAGCSEATLAKTDSAYIGTGDYGYDASNFADYENSAARTSSMKYKFNEWFTTNLTSVSSKLKTTTACIGDTTNAYTDAGVLMTETEKQNAITNYSSFYYNSNIRLYGTGQTANATLMCNATGGKTAETQIFPLTADEVVFAGGKAGAYNYAYYLRDNATTGWWWTLSPASFYGNHGRDSAFLVYSSGLVDFGGHVSTDRGSLRPAVSLASGTQFLSGDGSIGNPYKIK